MKFPDSKMELGMELEYRKFHMDLNSQSGIQDGFPTLNKTVENPPKVPNKFLCSFHITQNNDSSNNYIPYIFQLKVSLNNTK